MSTYLHRIGGAAAGILIGCSLCLAADPAETTVREVQQSSPDFMVHAAVNRESGDYREGDTFSMRVVCERDAYIYVIYQQADGQAYQVFPNVAQQRNRVKAKEVVQIPAADDQFRWRISGPFGKETVKVIASEEPLEELSEQQMRSKRFNAVSREQLKGITSKLVTKDATSLADAESETSRWAETEISVTTYPGNHDAAASGKKRFAVFFGVSKYEFSEQTELVTEHGLNLSSPQQDALLLDEVMRDIGDLDQSRVYINDGATRANLEHAVTRWLPERSKPGDTVFIYFSGHGGQVDDDGGDEKDKLDEFLLPYDYLGLAGLIGLIKQEEAGTLSKQYRELVPQAKKLIANAGSAEKAHERLVRRFGVTDDLFGHWLQSLSGREIVVILDICHAGGFANNEKAIISVRFPKRNRRRDKPAVRKPDASEQEAGASAADESKQGRSFAFLDHELGRLKDIGQAKTSLMTASSTVEVSLVRPDGVLSVMTNELIVALKEAHGPLDIQDGFAKVKMQCENFFASDEFRKLQETAGSDEGQIKPHHPLLYSNTSERVWLKP